jgi:hypothetical protein
MTEQSAESVRGQMDDHYCVFGWHHEAGEDCECRCSFCKAALIDG